MSFHYLSVIKAFSNVRGDQPLLAYLKERAGKSLLRKEGDVRWQDNVSLCEKMMLLRNVEIYELSPGVTSLVIAL